MRVWRNRLIDPRLLVDVRRTIRKFLVLDEDDAVDLVVLASIIANFDPQREVPVWMVLVGQPASAKTDIISLVQPWRYIHPLPDDLSGSTFQSSKTHNRSLLQRVQESDTRILFAQDMGSLMDLHRNVSGQIYQQLRGIHDGMLIKETGYDSTPIVYGEQTRVDGRAEMMTTAIPPAKRLGWLGAATPEFHNWQSSHNRLGSRFTCYTWLPHGKDDYARLSEIDRRRLEKAHWRSVATAAALKLLDAAVADIDALAAVELTNQQRDRLAAAVKIVNRVTGTTRVTDTGARLHPRIVAMVRAIAYLSGRTTISEPDMLIGNAIALSQLRHSDQRQIVDFALLPANLKKAWTLPDLTRASGNVRRMFEKTIEDMSDVGILDKNGKREWGGGFRYRASDSLRKLALVAYPKLKDATKDVEPEEIESESA